MIQIVYFLHGIYLVLPTVKNYSLILDYIALEILIKLFTKIIKMRGLKLRPQLLYFLSDLI
jgi:hypothetical protein